MNIVVLVIFNKSCVLLNEAQLDFQEGPGRVPKRVFGALARSQGALGTRVQVHGAFLGGRLDRQEFASLATSSWRPLGGRMEVGRSPGDRKHVAKKAPSVYHLSKEQAFWTTTF